MDKEFKAVWIEALLSGKYLQVAGRLQGTRVTDGEIGHCCFGVLCAVVPDVGYMVGNLRSSDDWTKHTSLGFIARHFAGINEKHNRVLMAMNDEGIDFHMIADYIEREL